MAFAVTATGPRCPAGSSDDSDPERRLYRRSRRTRRRDGLDTHVLWVDLPREHEQEEVAGTSHDSAQPQAQDAPNVPSSCTRTRACNVEPGGNDRRRFLRREFLYQN